MLLPLFFAAAAAMPPVCQDSRPQMAGNVRPSPAPLLRRLDQLPPANVVLTVLRSDGRCTAPVIIRYGVGARPAR